MNQVDKFLFWWTVLEVYPAKGTTHVARETANLLQRCIYVDKNPSEIKTKLELGRMHMMRGKIVHDGKLESLKRFKDDVKDVAEGFECGIKVANFDTVNAGDVIEAYKIEEIARKLERKSDRT